MPKLGSVAQLRREVLRLRAEYASPLRRRQSYQVGVKRWSVAIQAVLNHRSRLERIPRIEFIPL
jgi:hypothetical protein